MPPETDLTSLHVSLPKAQREFVEAEAARSGCTTTSEYFRRLIAEAQQRSAQERLEQLLLEGLESGDAAPFESDFFDKLRARLTRSKSGRGSDGTS